MEFLVEFFVEFFVDSWDSVPRVIAGATTILLPWSWRVNVDQLIVYPGVASR